MRRPRQLHNAPLRRSQKTVCSSFGRFAKQPKLTPPNVKQQHRITKLAKKHIGEHLNHVIENTDYTFQDKHGVWAFEHVSSGTGNHTVSCTLDTADYEYYLTISAVTKK